MSVWTTKSQGIDRDYIVIKHTLPGVNNIIQGVKFRGGFAVVEKNSKLYYNLKKLPVLRKAQEYPIIHLRKLPFITRTRDIHTIFGADVYLKFLKEENKGKEVEAVELKIEEDASHLFENEKCKFLTPRKEFCKEDMRFESPSGYCWKHILKDPKLAELGIEVPKFVQKQDKKLLRDRVLIQLAELKKIGKF